MTGTKDKDENLIWYVEACLGNALRLETYIQDADREGDSEVADLFRKAQATAARAPRWASSCCARAGLLTGTGHRSRRKRSGAPNEITGAEPRFWMLPTAVRWARHRRKRIICPGLRGPQGVAFAAGHGGPALASAGVHQALIAELRRYLIRSWQHADAPGTS